MARQKQNKKRGGGPKSVTGKQASSQNSTTHGLRATKATVLADEQQSDYDATRAGWFETYQPENYHETRLVEQLVLNDWLLQRANRRLLETEAALTGDDKTCQPAHWTAEQEHKIELVQRYKTTHERAFYRSLNAVESLRKDLLRNMYLRDRMLEKKDAQLERMRQELHTVQKTIERLEPKPQAQPETPEQAKAEQAKAEQAKADAPGLTKAQQVFGGQKSKKKQKKIAILDQWIEIEVLPNGKTLTQLHPSNEILIQNGQKMWPPPTMVYRRMHFMNGVPPEYYWTTSEESIRASGGMGIQRMTTDTWLELIEKEKELGTGHVLPCGGNLLRPEERGGCDCPTCSHNRAILEAEAA